WCASYAQLKESMLDSTSRLFVTGPDASGQGDAGDAETPTGEHALVEAAQRDPAAFAALYQVYFARVYRYLRVRLRSEEDAADLTQQAFLKALDALPRYRTHGAPFAAWLFTIARHTLADRYHRLPATLPLEAANEVQAEHGMEAAVLRHESFEQLA